MGAFGNGVRWGTPERRRTPHESNFCDSGFNGISRTVDIKIGLFESCSTITIISGLK